MKIPMVDAKWGRKSIEFARSRAVWTGDQLTQSATRRVSTSSVGIHPSVRQKEEILWEWPTRLFRSPDSTTIDRVVRRSLRVRFLLDRRNISMHDNPNKSHVHRDYSPMSDSSSSESIGSIADACVDRRTAEEEYRRSKHVRSDPLDPLGTTDSPRSIARPSWSLELPL